MHTCTLLENRLNNCLILPPLQTKSENAKGMYVLIKLIDLIERQYNFDRIAESDYTTLLEKNLSRVDMFKKQINNFHIERFCEVRVLSPPVLFHPILSHEFLWYVASFQEYGLQECTWAKERIKAGLD